MKKKLIMIMLSAFTALSPLQVYANGKLTYDTALKTAIKNNLSLERTKKSLEEIESSLTTGFYSLDNSLKANMSASLQYTSALDSEKATKMSYQAQQEAMELSLKKIFLDIEHLEKNSKLIDEKIDNMRSTLSVNAVKYKHGVISKVDYESAELEFEKLKTTQKENKLKLDTAYKELENLLGTKNSEKIEYIDVEYEPFAQLGISVESAVGRAISGSATIFRQNASIRVLEEQIKYDLLSVSQTSLPKSEASLSVSMQDVNLRTSKQSLENAVIETANTIENLELNIKNIDGQMENIKLQSNNMAVMVKLGYSTKLDLEKLNLTIKELELTKQNLLNSHSLMVERYKKPYLLSLTGE